MSKRKNVKAIFIEVPENEYIAYKMQMAKDGISLQKLIRIATAHWIRKSEKTSIKDDA